MMKAPTTQNANVNVQSTKQIRCCQNICFNKDFWNNKYNIFRLFMIFLVIIFINLCILYSIGQLCRLELDNYLCDNNYSIEDIRRYNQQNKNHHDTCLTTQDGIINESQLYATKDIVYTAVFDLTPFNIIKMLSFTLTGFILLMFLIIHSTKLSQDCIRFYHNRWHYKYFTPKKKKPKKQKRLCCAIFEQIKQCLVNNCCIKWYKYWFTSDRVLWIYWLMTREIFEVFIQTVALLQYGGYYKVMETSNNSAEKPIYVIIFSVILTLNCITVGSIWLLYILRHDSYQGRYFNGIILIIDAIFDIFYSFFPLIIHNHYKIGSILFFASFQSYSLINYLSMIIPLMFLSSKMFTILGYSSSQSRKYWRLLFAEREYQKQQIELQIKDPVRTDSLSQVQIKAQQRMSARHGFTVTHLNDTLDKAIPDVDFTPQSVNINNIQTTDRLSVQSPIPKIESNATPMLNQSELSSDVYKLSKIQRKQTPKSVNTFNKSNQFILAKICSLLCSGPIYLMSPLPDKRLSPAKFFIQAFRRCQVVNYGMMMFLYGILIIIYIISHFTTSIQFCNNNGNAQLHPELKLWPYCRHKIYPFFLNSFDETYPCQCRSIFMAESDFIHLEYVNSEIVESLFEKWWMLEFIVLHNRNNSNLTIELSNKHMTSSLQILSLKNIHVTVDLHESSSWINLGFLRIDNGLISMNWKRYKNKLHEIKYLSLEGTQSNNISSFVSNLDLRKLKYLSLKNAVNIKQLPFDYTLENRYLQNVQYINFVNIDDFNMKLLSLPKLKQYVHYLGNIVITNNQNHSIKYNNYTNYYFQGTAMCKMYRQQSIQYLNQYVYEFLHSTNACELSPYQNNSDLNLCPPPNWNDGICDIGCNNIDGADCV